jgi:hypothetical protein
MRRLKPLHRMERLHELTFAQSRQRPLSPLMGLPFSEERSGHPPAQEVLRLAQRCRRRRRRADPAGGVGPR